jgi:hypothetical protein
MGRAEKARAIIDSAAKRLVDLNRGVLVLKVDLTDPKNRLRPSDAMRDPPRLVRFDRRSLPRVLAAVEAHEPWRTGIVRERYLEGMSGLVAERGGEVLGYVFWTEGTDHPGCVVHSDLRWLGVHPSRGEIYMFDYFLIPAARGLGAIFARAVQEEHHGMGYSAAYGCVFQSNRAALWLYRTTGWAEVKRVTEHRILSKIAIVGRTMYWMRAHSRTPIAELM